MIAPENALNDSINHGRACDNPPFPTVITTVITISLKNSFK